MPSDAVGFLSEAEYKLAHHAISSGGDFNFSESGAVIVIDPQPEPISSLLKRVKSEVRTMRAPMLDALAGIAGRAARAGNDALTSEADALAEQLLDITDDPALNSANTYDEMQAAGMAAYRRIASGASAELASVFKEITGV